MHSVSILIPCYNEEKRIEKSLKRVLLYLESKKNDLDYEVITINDGSNDKTLEILNKYNGIKVISYGQNRGKGYAVNQGVLNSNKNLILLTDADLSTPIEELEKFLEISKEGHDILIGSRKVKESIVTQPKSRRIAGNIFNKITKVLFLGNFYDTQCGFKLFKKDVAKDIFSKAKIEGFAFDVEILHIANKKRYKIKEVPITWVNEGDSKVKVGRDSYRMLRDIIKIRINSLRGKYE